MIAAAIENVFPDADGMRHVAAAGGDDAPDHPLLVVIEPDDVARAGQGQVAAIEMRAAPGC